mmetsp:Transcript_66007/g.123081  ORF Transcript_66007/g.123081 Transcript_66007/m.123081 type:complete len:461 (+) Transcript_66007:115-1497(+)
MRDSYNSSALRLDHGGRSVGPALDLNELSRKCAEGGCSDILPSLIPLPICALVTAVVCTDFMLAAEGRSSWDRLLARLDASAGNRDRCHIIDNSKFLLQAMVVAGHLFPPSIHVQIMAGPYPWLVFLPNYMRSFHVPMYAFLSGLVTRGPLTRDKVRRLTQGVLIPYLILNMFVLDLRTSSGLLSEPQVPTPWDPTHLWYLPALLGWHALASLLECCFSRVGILVASYVISWVSGYWCFLNQHDYMVNQMLALFCFFGTGYCIPVACVRLLEQRMVRYCGLVVTCFFLLLHFSLAKVTPLHVATEAESLRAVPSYSLWAFWNTQVTRHPYFVPQVQLVQAIDPYIYYTVWMQRLAVQFLVTWPCGLAFLAVVPHSETFFTELGKHSMYSYVFHRVVIDSHYMAPMYALVRQKEHLHYAMAALSLAAGLATLMCSRLTRCFTSWIVEPTWMEHLWTAPRLK